MRGSTLTRFAAAAALATILAACGGADDPADQPPGQAEPSETTAPGDQTPADAPSSPDPTDSEPTEDGTTDPDDEPAGDLEGVDVQPEGQELMLRIGDQVHVVGLLDPEGESFWRHATVWPGSSRDDLTIVGLTQAEGMYDLRWLTFAEGQESEVKAFPTEYQPDPALAGVEDVVPTPVFSPDGRSLAWLEWNADGEVTLRTVGWSDGPGTGRTADDNAAFALDELEPGVQLQSWQAGSGDESQLHAVSAEGASWTITIVRQADGALALGSDAVQQG